MIATDTEITSRSYRAVLSPDKAGTRNACGTFHPSLTFRAITHGRKALGDNCLFRRQVWCMLRPPNLACYIFLLFLAEFGPVAVGQNDYGLSFVGPAPGLYVSPDPGTEVYTCQDAPALNRVNPFDLWANFLQGNDGYTGIIVKNDQGWIPRSSSKNVGNGEPYSVSANGILTWLPSPWGIGLGQGLESGYFTGTLDMNTGNLIIQEHDAFSASCSPQAYPVCACGSFTEIYTGVVKLAFYPFPAIKTNPPSTSVLNPYACSLSPANCATQGGSNSILSAVPAAAISADGQSAAVIAVTSGDAIDPVEFELSAMGFSGAMGSLALYDPNFLNASSGPNSGNKSITVEAPTSCDSAGDCTFLALLWAPNSMSGSAQPIPLTVTATQGTSTKVQTEIQLQPPPLVFVHGIWSNAAAEWPAFEQWLDFDYPSHLIFAADYGKYNSLAYSDPKIQRILEATIANALASVCFAGRGCAKGGCCSA